MVENIVLGQSLSEMLKSVDTNVLTYGIVIALVAIAVAVMWTSESIHRRKGRDSQAKKRIAEIVNQAVPEGEKVTVAFADWLTVDNDYKAGKRTTRYWRFAIGFNDSRIYIIPVSIGDNEKITGKDCVCVERSQLGLVNAKENGKWMELYGRDRKKICTLKVEAYYTTGMLANQPVDIAQPEAAEEFKKLIRSWLQAVNSANGVSATGFHNNAGALDLKAQVGDPENKGYAAGSQPGDKK